MNLKTLLTHLLKEETPDEEERGEAPQASHDPRSTRNSDDDGLARENEKITQDDADSEHDHDEDSDDALNLNGQPDESPRGVHRIFSRVLSTIFPSPDNEEEIRAYIPHYRILPIVSGITIPFSILLEIPGLTADWYIHTSGSTVISSKHNPLLMDVGIALSILCAVLANTCLVVRFLEKRIKTMTILCVVFLSIHDVINVVALAIFGATKYGYTYGQAFWMTLCSTIVSSFTNVTLVFDLIRTPDFKRSGSGLTRRQRSLIIIIIGLFCYIALGSLANSLLLGLTFINGLYFTVATLETIGFGDILPTTRGSRVFVCFYAVLGIINLAFVVGYIRETVLEGINFGYRRRLLEIQEKRRAARRRRRAENRWRHAIIWRLRERHAPIWIPESDRESLWTKLKSCFWLAEWKILLAARRSKHKSGRRPGMKLNLWALPQYELEAAALEAGVPLDTLLPPDFYDTYDQDAFQQSTGVEHHTPSWFVAHPVYHCDERASEPLTYHRLGVMAAILTKVGFSVYESGGSPLPNGHDAQNGSATGPEAAPDSSATLQSNSTEDGDYRTEVEDTEKRAYYMRTGLSWSWFLIFWMGGAAIFTATEGWSYGTSVYFCFIAFTTIGYGDSTPTTPAGRSIFVVWALVGVATMTIFISVVSEEYTSRYKGILGRNSFKSVVKKYRRRTRTELSEKVQRSNASTGVRFDTYDLLRREDTMAVNEESLTPVNPTGPPLTSSPEPDVHAQREQAQRTLERLPQQILAQARTIQQYTHLIGDFDGHLSSEMDKFVDETVWGLVDEVVGGKKLAECTKTDILKDGESRQTLMLLGIERSLKELVSISEQAMAAVQERDQIVVSSTRDEEHDIAEGERGS